MAEKKISRKELLKEPDEFLTTTGQVLRFVSENPRTVTIAAVVALVVMLAVVGVMTYFKHQQNTSAQLFEKGLREYHAVVDGLQPPTPEQLDKLLSQFDAVAKNYGSYESGEMAILYSGHVLYRKGDFKAALERYNRMQNTALAKTGLGPMILYHIATTRLALKEYDAASTLFTQLSEDPTSPYRREAYGAIARIYEAMGKEKEAAQAYRQYLKMFPEAPDAPYVKARLADLSAKG